MKNFSKTLLILALFIIGCGEEDPAPVAAEPEEELEKDPLAHLELVANEDHAKVFQGAFWRHPADDDEVLHAERRQWSDPDNGVRNWQWFIALRPGAELEKYLATNPFRVTSFDPANLSGSEWVRDAPAWFPELSEVHKMSGHKSADGKFMLLRHGDILYAFDTGTGFAVPVN